VSGFQHAPGSPERRAADRTWIEQHRTSAVKNPARYNVDTEHAFGIAHALPGAADAWYVEYRGADGSEPFDSLDELLDAGWTVD
jgi:hypothetical protein